MLALGMILSFALGWVLMWLNEKDRKAEAAQHAERTDCLVDLKLLLACPRCHRFNRHAADCEHWAETYPSLIYDRVALEFHLLAMENEQLEHDVIRAALENDSAHSRSAFTSVTSSDAFP